MVPLSLLHTLVPSLEERGSNPAPHPAAALQGFDVSVPLAAPAVTSYIIPEREKKKKRKKVNALQ